MREIQRVDHDILRARADFGRGARSRAPASRQDKRDEFDKGIGGRRARLRPPEPSLGASIVRQRHEAHENDDQDQKREAQRSHPIDRAKKRARSRQERGSPLTWSGI